MNHTDQSIWILTFALLGLAGAAIASVTAELRRLRMQREQHEASATERHAEEVAHLSAIRVAIIGHGAVIGQALETAAEAVRDTPVLPPPDEVLASAPLASPVPHIDLRPELPAPPDATDGPDAFTDDDVAPTATFHRT